MLSLVNIKSAIKNRNFQHGMLYTFFSFINNGISFVLLLILARYLTPGEYGSVNLFTTFVTLVSIIISLCTTSFVTVSFFQKSKETLRQIILIALFTSTIMLILLSLILVLFPSLSERAVGVSMKYLWQGVLICYFQVFNSLNLDIWRLEEKPVSYGLYGVSFAISNFILTIWFIVSLHQGWQGRVNAWMILALIYFAVSLIFLIKRKYLVFSLPDLSLFKETYIYALPLIPHTASFWMKQGLDRIIINYFHGQTVVGYFSFAMNLAAIINIVGTAFNATNSVYIFKKLADGYEKVRNVLSKQAKVMVAIFLAVSLGVCIMAYTLIHFFLPKYTNSVIYLFPLCLGGFFQCVYLLWVNYLFFYKKTRKLMLITITTAMVQFVLSLWLTRYSPVYTAYISMMITAITMILVRRSSIKELKLSENQ